MAELCSTPHPPQKVAQPSTKHKAEASTTTATPRPSAVQTRVAETSRRRHKQQTSTPVNQPKNKETQEQEGCNYKRKPQPTYQEPENPAQPQPVETLAATQQTPQLPAPSKQGPPHSTRRRCYLLKESCSTHDPKQADTAASLSFNINILLWVLMSTISLCMYTHHTTPFNVSLSTLNPTMRSPSHPNNLDSPSPTLHHPKSLTLLPPSYPSLIHSQRDTSLHLQKITLPPYPPALLNCSLLPHATTNRRLPVPLLAPTPYHSLLCYKIPPDKLPPTSRTTHALHTSATPTHNHPQHTIVSPKRYTYHLQHINPHKHQTQHSAQPVSLPSKSRHRSCRPPHTQSPPQHLLLPTTHTYPPPPRKDLLNLVGQTRPRQQHTLLPETLHPLPIATNTPKWPSMLKDHERLYVDTLCSRQRWHQLPTHPQYRHTGTLLRHEFYTLHRHQTTALRNQPNQDNHTHFVQKARSHSRPTSQPQESQPKPTQKTQSQQHSRNTTQKRQNEVRIASRKRRTQAYTLDAEVKSSLAIWVLTNTVTMCAPHITHRNSHSNTHSLTCNATTHLPRNPRHQTTTLTHPPLKTSRPLLTSHIRQAQIQTNQLHRTTESNAAPQMRHPPPHSATSQMPNPPRQITESNAAPKIRQPSPRSEIRKTPRSPALILFNPAFLTLASTHPPTHLHEKKQTSTHVLQTCTFPHTVSDDSHYTQRRTTCYTHYHNHSPHTRSSLLNHCTSFPLYAWRHTIFNLIHRFPRAYTLRNTPPSLAPYITYTTAPPTDTNNLAKHTTSHLSSHHPHCPLLHLSPHFPHSPSSHLSQYP